MQSLTGILFNTNWLFDNDGRFFQAQYILGCIRLPHTIIIFPLFCSRRGVPVIPKFTEAIFKSLCPKAGNSGNLTYLYFALLGCCAIKVKSFHQ